jgi:uncharacterized protein YcfJ
MEETMSTIRAYVVLILTAALALGGCVSVPERYPALDNAHASVNVARNDPLVVAYAPAELRQAIDTVRQADALAAANGSSAEIQQLALLASQRATLAQDVARTRSAEANLQLQRKVSEAQLAADASRRQAEAAQVQAAAAQRQADEAQRLASSVRTGTYAPTVYDYRRRPDERLYEVNVTSARAVVGPPQERCWLEREQVVSPGATGSRIAGAVVGGVIGGILGHQIGDGRGQDLATGIGAIGGAAVGASVAGNQSMVYDRNVRHCEFVPTAAQPDYWDVSYVFGGREHYVQMTSLPGSTLWVNAQGEPRV